MEKIKDVSEKFVRVAVTRIEGIDLNYFEFDLDLTMMIFFLAPDGQIYARYGGRDGKDAEGRQSLDGLRHTMNSVLEMHSQKSPIFAGRRNEKSLYLRDVQPRRGFRRGCVHCHDAKELINTNLFKKGKWSNSMVWRYPLPENLGFRLDVHLSNVVERIENGSPAAKAGLQTGDVVTVLNRLPVHSFGDAQYALDRAPKKGEIDIAWKRSGKPMTAKLPLPEGWYKVDYSWRASVWRLVPTIPLFGFDLNAEDRKALGLSPTQLAFRQRDDVHSHALKAGIRGGDVIVGINEEKLEMDFNAFYRYVRRCFVVDDRININVLRDGKQLKVALTLKYAGF